MWSMVPKMGEKRCPLPTQNRHDILLFHLMLIFLERAPRRRQSQPTFCYYHYVDLPWPSGAHRSQNGISTCRHFCSPSWGGYKKSESCTFAFRAQRPHCWTILTWMDEYRRCQNRTSRCGPGCIRLESKLVCSTFTVRQGAPSSSRARSAHQIRAGRCHS